MLHVLTSGIWQLSSVVVASEGACLVVDPAFFPRELSELRARVEAHGRAVAVAFTHVHWDHVVGWQTFPEAEVWTSEALARSIARAHVDDDAEAKRALDKARGFDREWYIERAAPLRWPSSARPLREGDRLDVGALHVRAISLPGHSADGLGLVVEEARALIVGDHLSPCEIPFVDDLAGYRATLRRLIDLLATLDAVVPGHGRRLTAREAVAIARDDLDYLDAIADAAERNDVARARAIPLPRLDDDAIMRAHHRDNCASAGLVFEP
jgi:glyoxylase-like metal-dependent hydrolase (beta-lactamase superfamily II)